MLKTLTKNDTQITPYVATKNWTLSNVDNTDVVLAENGNPISAENVLFGNLIAVPNYDCNVAKENQENDLATVRDGLKVTGLFYPELDPQNIDGTYKRMVHAQIKTMFYNNYRNPTQIWGTEKIDFDLSGTKKFLSDLIKVFYIPTEIMGQKIVEGSVRVIDNTLDNDYVISDDGQNNLFAGDNLFSKQQELRYFSNQFQTGSDGFCNNYFSLIPNAPILTGQQIGQNGTFASASLSWSFSNSSLYPFTGFGLERSTDNASFSLVSVFNTSSYATFDFPISQSSHYFYRLCAYNVWGTGSYSNVVDIALPTWPSNFTYTPYSYVSGVNNFPTFDTWSGGFLNTSAGFCVSASNSLLVSGGTTTVTASATGSYTGPTLSASLHLNSYYFHSGFGGGIYSTINISQSNVGILSWQIYNAHDNNRTVPFVLSSGSNTSIIIQLFTLLDVAETTVTYMSGSFSIP